MKRPTALLPLLVILVLFMVAVACGAQVVTSAGTSATGSNPENKPQTPRLLATNVAYAAEAPAPGPTPTADNPSFSPNYPFSETPISGNMATASPVAGLECILKEVIPPMHPLSHFAMEVDAGSLGIGIKAATPVADRFNLRAGFNILGYNTTRVQNGITYNASLTLRSAEASLDWFPFRGRFHLSPGVMFYNGNRIQANLNIPLGTVFTLNNVNYYSDPSDPLTGSAKISFPVAGPEFTMGFGNMLPRRPRQHFSIPFEIGAAYFGIGNTQLLFQGSACTALGGNNCMPVNSFPRFQADLAAEQVTIQSYVKDARFFPILRVGLSYKF